MENGVVQGPHELLGQGPHDENLNESIGESSERESMKRTRKHQSVDEPGQAAP